MSFIFFFFIHAATTAIYTLSLHDALPILLARGGGSGVEARSRLLRDCRAALGGSLSLGTGCHQERSEEHTSELQSPMYLVCRLLLEKKKITQLTYNVRITYISTINSTQYC